jgi:hypothetical protein
MRRYLLFFLVFLTIAVSAQGPPKAVLVEEHGQLPCDDSLGRLDNWYSELSKDPNSTGLAVISIRPEEKHLSVFRQNLMESNALFRGASKVLKLKYVRANSSEDLKVQLWRIPAGAEEPRIENVDNTFVLPSHITPFLLGKEYPDYLGADNICPGEPSDQRIFASFLKDNQSARGNIVVRERTVAKAQEKAVRIRNAFKRLYRIPPARLRVFPRKRTVPANYLEPIVEYWYLP